MAQESISVTLATGSGSYQKTLPQALAAEDLLRRVLNLGPSFEVQEPCSNQSLKTIKRFKFRRFVNRVVWGVWRRLPVKLRGEPPAMFSAWLTDRSFSHWIGNSNIFHGYTGVCLAGLRVARENGAITLIEHAHRHPRHWQESVKEEHKRFGVATISPVFSDRLIRRMELEFRLCDYIVVPSKVAYDSLASLGYEEKTVIVHTGADATFFSPAAKTHRPPFRVCYVGRVELAKGIGYLLEAWERIRLRDAELILVGEVKPDIKPMLQSHADSTVSVVGFATPEQVAEYYRQSSLFVFPSVNEGLGQALLEAMASGLMVLATDKSGAQDCVTDGVEGLIVPARDANELARALLWSYEHPEQLLTMGRAARARIEAEFTLDHYNRRVIALYRSLFER